jgi:hypothetical protein
MRAPLIGGYTVLLKSKPHFSTPTEDCIQELLITFEVSALIENKNDKIRNPSAAILALCYYYYNTNDNSS